MIIVIKKLNVPKVILRKILMLLNVDDIKNVILNVKEMNLPYQSLWI